MQALTNQKSRTVSSWLLIGLNLNVNKLKAVTFELLAVTQTNRVEILFTKTKLQNLPV